MIVYSIYPQESGPAEYINEEISVCKPIFEAEARRLLYQFRCSTALQLRLKKKYVFAPETEGDCRHQRQGVKQLLFLTKKLYFTSIYRIPVQYSWGWCVAVMSGVYYNFNVRCGNVENR